MCFKQHVHNCFSCKTLIYMTLSVSSVWESHNEKTVTLHLHSKCTQLQNSIHFLQSFSLLRDCPSFKMITIYNYPLRVLPSSCPHNLQRPMHKLVWPVSKQIFSIIFHGEVLWGNEYNIIILLNLEMLQTAGIITKYGST